MSAFLPDYSLAEIWPSPNFGDRLATRTPDMILLHYTGMPTGESALTWLLSPESEVSSHYFVGEDGEILQLVPEAKRAWHAGRSFWKGNSDINSASIGIEIVNSGHSGAGHPGGLPDFPQVQIDAVIALCADIIARYDIRPERVLAHSDVAPIRKVDPGEKFPWDRLFYAGIGHYVVPSTIAGGRFLQKGDGGQPVEALQSMLSLYGYQIPVSGQFCEQTEGVVSAFQRHFRSSLVDGVADVSTIDTLHKLLISI